MTDRVKVLVSLAGEAPCGRNADFPVGECLTTDSRRLENQRYSAVKAIRNGRTRGCSATKSSIVTSASGNGFCQVRLKRRMA